MGRLSGKRAVVTGGGRGIGAAIVQRLVRDGASVALNYRSDSHTAEALAAGPTDDETTVVAPQADVTWPVLTRARPVSPPLRHRSKGSGMTFVVDRVGHRLPRDRAVVLDVLGPSIEILTDAAADPSAPMLLRGTIPAGGVVPVHAHGDPETFYVLAGSVDVLSYPLDAPDSPRLPPDPSRAAAMQQQSVARGYWNATPEQNAAVGIELPPTP